MRGSLQVKIGGGYQPIEEFIAATLPVELEKLERKDPLKKVTEAPSAVNHSVKDNKSSTSRQGTMARLPSKMSSNTAMTPIRKRGN